MVLRENLAKIPSEEEIGITHEERMAKDLEITKHLAFDHARIYAAAVKEAARHLSNSDHIRDVAYMTTKDYIKHQEMMRNIHIAQQRMLG